MNIGDLVRCNFQPRCGGYDSKKQRLMKMEHNIKGELGIIIATYQHRHHVIFPQLGYTHHLTESVLKVINESR